MCQVVGQQVVYTIEPMLQELREVTEYFAGRELKPSPLERIEELRALFPHGIGP